MMGYRLGSESPSPLLRSQWITQQSTNLGGERRPIPRRAYTRALPGLAGNHRVEGNRRQPIAM